MAGELQENKSKNLDILFDLTPEDSKKLRESDLLQLVNYGQVSDPIQVFGTDGKEYTMGLALLWDEDFMDNLRKTTTYANDPLLRARILRRLKLHKAIQSIDNRDYSDDKDMVAQRELWAILCHLSDAQVEYIDAKYAEIEINRNVSMTDAIKELNKKLNETAPDISLKSEKGTSEKTQSLPTDAEESAMPDQSFQQDEHEILVREVESGKKNAEKVVTDIIKEQIADNQKSSIPKSPKQSTSKPDQVSKEKK